MIGPNSVRFARFRECIKAIQATLRFATPVAVYAQKISRSGRANFPCQSACKLAMTFLAHVDQKAYLP